MSNTIPEHPNFSALLTVRDVAALLAVSAVTVRRLVRAGDLRSIRIGGSIRFDRGEIEALVARGTQARSADGEEGVEDDGACRGVGGGLDEATGI